MKGVHSTVKCLLCYQPTLKGKVYDWEMPWSQNCSESLEKLLDIEEFSSEFFRSGEYCQPCEELVRDVDFCFRSVTSLQYRLSNARIKISGLLLNSYDSNLGGGEEISLSPCSDLSSRASEIHHTAPVFSEDSSSTNAIILTGNFVLDDESSTVTPDDLNDTKSRILSSDVNTEGCEIESELKPILQPEKDDAAGMSYDPPSSSVVLTRNEVQELRVLPPRRSRRIQVQSYAEDSEEDVDDDADAANWTPDPEAEPESDESSEGELELAMSEENQMDPPRKSVRSRSLRTTTNSLSEGAANTSTRKRKHRKMNTPSSETSLPWWKLGVILSTKEESEFEFMDRLKQETGLGKMTKEDIQLSLKAFVHKFDAEMSAARVTVGLSISEEDSRRMFEEEELLIFLLQCELESYQASLSYICTNSDCDGRFVDFVALRRHVGLVHQEHLEAFPFQCAFCKRRTRSEDLMDAHIHRIHAQDRMPFHCQFPECFKKFLSGVDLGDHMKRRHKDAAIAMEAPTKIYEQIFQYLDKSTVGLVRSKRAMRQTYKGTTFCMEEGCTFRARTSKVLEFHRREVHEKVAKPFKCSECGREFKSRGTHDYHVHDKHNPNVQRVKCLYCPREFSNPAQFKMHVLKLHADSAIVFKCSVCERDYYREEDCVAHEKLHERHKTNCVLKKCVNFRHETLEALRAHIQTEHTIQRTCICEICGHVAKGVRAPYQMQAHMKRHKETRFKCKFCEKYMKARHELTRHEETTHPDKIQKRVYPCKLCDKTFAVRQYLYKHNAWHKYGSDACRPIAKQKSRRVAQET